VKGIKQGSEAAATVALPGLRPEIESQEGKPASDLTIHPRNSLYELGLSRVGESARPTLVGSNGSLGAGSVGDILREPKYEKKKISSLRMTNTICSNLSETMSWIAMRKSVKIDTYIVVDSDQKIC